MAEALNTVLKQRWGPPFLAGLVIGGLIGAVVTFGFINSKFYAEYFPGLGTSKKEDVTIVDVEKKAQPQIEISGRWILENTIYAANDSKYNNLVLRFKMYLDQSDEKISGSLVKFMENGDTIPENSRTKIDLSGVVSGKSVLIEYQEKGGTGQMRWDFNNTTKMLEGDFESSVAISRGKSIAYRRNE